MSHKYSMCHTCCILAHLEWESYLFVIHFMSSRVAIVEDVFKIKITTLLACLMSGSQ